MKFKTNEIPEAGLELSEGFDAKKRDIEAPEIKFDAPVQARAVVTKSHGEVYVSVSVTGTMILRCVGCLAAFEASLAMDMEFVYSAAAEEIVLDGDIRQEIILSYPMKPLCKEDCKGLCPACGQNLNEGECDHRR